MFSRLWPQWRLWLAALWLSACAWGPLQAKEAAPASTDPLLEKQTMAVSAELRCLVCQNQTIADSNADLAVDLRNQVREMLRQGKTQAQIVDYMTARYGDFVLYRPPVKNTTALLWFGPPLLLGLGLFTLWWVLRGRSRLGKEHFDADDTDEANEANEANEAPAQPGELHAQPHSAQRTPGPQPLNPPAR